MSATIHRPVLNNVRYAVGVVVSLSCIFFLWFRPMEQVRYANLHLIGIFLVYLFIIYDEREGLSDPDWRRLVSVYGTAIFCFFGFLGSIYVELLYVTLSYERYGIYTTPDLLAGGAVILGVLVAVRHAYGWIITSIGVFALAFGLYGPYFPGILNHAGLDVAGVIGSGALDFSGVYDNIFQISATYVFIFIIWASLVQTFGGLNAFINLATRIGNRTKSGISQTAVVASMFMGSINGSTIANIAVTGSFTIPLMKRRGLRSNVAGAIETVASTGGMILPPVMGSVAFLMAVFLPYSYGEIIVMAAIPSLLFYGSVVVAVHFTVLREDVPLQMDYSETANNQSKDTTNGSRETAQERTGSRSKIEIDPSKGTMYYLRKLVPVLVSLALLVYLLLGPMLGPGTAGVYIIATLTGLEFLNRITGTVSLSEGAIGVVKDFFDGLSDGAYQIAPLSFVLAMMGILIALFSVSGVGFRLSFSVVQLSGGSIVVLLFLVMVSSIVLGMGMPTPAAYVLVITLIAPAMVEVGFQDVTAHFFVFYFAILSTMTPPIAVGAAVASRIADGDFLPTALVACRIGLPLFLLPYLLTMHEQLIVISGLGTIATFVLAMAGLVLLSYGLNRRFESTMTYLTNGALISGGVLLAFVGPLILEATLGIGAT